MELSALLLVVLLPTVAIGNQNVGALDVASVIDQFRSEITAAVREEIRVVAKCQQHVVAIADDQRLDLT